MESTLTTSEIETFLRFCATSLKGDALEYALEVQQQAALQSVLYAMDEATLVLLLKGSTLDSLTRNEPAVDKARRRISILREKGECPVLDAMKPTLFSGSGVPPENPRVVSCFFDPAHLLYASTTVQSMLGHHVSSTINRRLFKHLGEVLKGERRNAGAGYIARLSLYMDGTFGPSPQEIADRHGCISPNGYWIFARQLASFYAITVDTGRTQEQRTGRRHRAALVVEMLDNKYLGQLPTEGARRDSALVRGQSPLTREQQLQLIELAHAKASRMHWTTTRRGLNKTKQGILKEGRLLSLHEEAQVCIPLLGMGQPSAKSMLEKERATGNWPLLNLLADEKVKAIITGDVPVKTHRMTDIPRGYQQLVAERAGVALPLVGWTAEEYAEILKVVPPGYSYGVEGPTTVEAWSRMHTPRPSLRPEPRLPGFLTREDLISSTGGKTFGPFESYFHEDELV